MRKLKAAKSFGMPGAWQVHRDHIDEIEKYISSTIFEYVSDEDIDTVLSALHHLDYVEIEYKTGYKING